MNAKVKHLLIRVGAYIYTRPTHVKTGVLTIIARLVPLLRVLPLSQSTKFYIARNLSLWMRRQVQRTEQRAHDLAIEVTRDRWRKAQVQNR